LAALPVVLWLKVGKLVRLAALPFVANFALNADAKLVLSVGCPVIEAKLPPPPPPLPCALAYIFVASESPSRNTAPL